MRLKRSVLEMPYGAPSSAAGSPPLAFNYNGDMRVNQTHSTANQNYTAHSLNAADTQIFDNFPDFFGLQYTVNPARNFDQAVLFDDPINSTRGLSLSLRCNTAVPAGANDYIYAFTSVEGRDFMSLIDQDCTLRFWIKQTNTGTFPLIFFTNPANNGPVPHSASNIFLTNYTYAAAGVWTEFAIPIDFPLAGMSYPQTYSTDLLLRMAWPVFVGAGVRVAANLSGAWVASPGLTGYATTTDTNAMQAAGDTWQLGRVGLQLGAGGDYPDVPFTDTLNRARRRYWHTFPYGSIPAAGAGTAGEPIRYTARIGGVNTDGAFVQHPVQMRARPTVTFYSMTGAGTTWFNDTAGAPSGAAALANPISPSGVDAMLITNPQVAGDNGADNLMLHASFDARI